MFGAKGDGVTDDTEAIRKCIKSVYSATGTWTPTKEIRFPFGKYLVSSALIDSNLGVAAGMFNFVGEGKMASRIICTDSLTTLFDNTGVFGFTTFSNIGFYGNNNSRFMNFVGGGSGNSQGLNFNNCYFDKWKTIIETSGSTMSSEVTFLECKISSCGTTDNPCELFILNNAQGVNWRYFATDIESFVGVAFKISAGTTLSFYQGSIIPSGNDSTVFQVPSNANRNLFGENNSPTVNMNGSRFEMRGLSMLIDHQNTCYCQFIFKSCNMGGYNLSNDSIPIKAQNQCYIIMDDCYNTEKYKVSYTINTIAAITAGYIILNNTDMPNIFYSDSIISYNYTGNRRKSPYCIVNGVRRDFSFMDMPATVRNVKTVQNGLIQINTGWDDQSGESISSTGDNTTHTLLWSGLCNKLIFLQEFDRTAYGANVKVGGILYGKNKTNSDYTQILTIESQDINKAFYKEIEVLRYYNEWKFEFTISGTSYNPVIIPVKVFLSFI